MEIENVMKKKMENNKPEKQKNKVIATVLKKICKNFKYNTFFLLLTLLINTLYCNIKKLFHQLRFFYEKSGF